MSLLEWVKRLLGIRGRVGGPAEAPRPAPPKSNDDLDRRGHTNG